MGWLASFCSNDGLGALIVRINGNDPLPNLYDFCLALRNVGNREEQTREIEQSSATQRSRLQAHAAEAAKSNKMHDAENGNGDESLQYMNEADMMAELMALLSQEGMSDSKLRKILAYVERVLSQTD